MMSALSIMALGFFLGMRHALDADHVIAVATIVSCTRGARQAALTGMLWGMGHTLTIVGVGALIILFNVIVPPALGMGMELAVGLVLIGLGLGNIRRYLHRHPHSHAVTIDLQPAVPAASHTAAPAEAGRLRPLAVGIVHGLAGSSAVALLVLAAIQDPRWATAYLLVFGLGTIAGMMAVTMTMASAFRWTAGRSRHFSGHLGLASGVLSVAFGVLMACQIAGIVTW